ncbi:unknown protein [Seminavis robusta]|uniref:Uncharacterized protein n=1 Tax=Seminavis robusta TaxID=568900 RepID=A0A9N8EZ54_9STRA|nr:unknown protein [Seminavis robusta]|eukprot:Sro2674_g334370.1 n/a (257) ;mRNA; r:8654-9424
MSNGSVSDQPIDALRTAFKDRIASVRGFAAEIPASVSWATSAPAHKTVKQLATSFRNVATPMKMDIHIKQEQEKVAREQAKLEQTLAGGINEKSLEDALKEVQDGPVKDLVQALLTSVRDQRNQLESLGAVLVHQQDQELKRLDLVGDLGSSLRMLISKVGDCPKQHMESQYSTLWDLAAAGESLAEEASIGVSNLGVKLTKGTRDFLQLTAAYKKTTSNLQDRVATLGSQVERPARRCTSNSDVRYVVYLFGNTF